MSDLSSSKKSFASKEPAAKKESASANSATHANGISAVAPLQAVGYASTLQTKMTVGAPNDQYEQEADQVANRVMRMPEPDISPSKDENIEPVQAMRIQRMCPACEKKLQKQDEAEQDSPVPEIQTAGNGVVVNRQELPDEEAAGPDIRMQREDEVARMPEPNDEANSDIQMQREDEVARMPEPGEEDANPDIQIQAQEDVARMPEPGEEDANPDIQMQAQEPSPEAIQTKPALSSTPLQRAADDEDRDNAHDMGTASESGAPDVQMTAAEQDDDDSPLIQRMCPACGEKMVNRQENGDDSLQTKSKQPDTPAVSPSVESQIHSSRGGGEPLSGETQDYFESRMGYDFSGVRVHSDDGASSSASSLKARAFTSGQDIFFNSGEYSPQTSGGQQLLAHELTHVVQQDGGTGGPVQKIQRAPADYQHPEDGDGVHARLKNKIKDAVKKGKEENTDPAEARQKMKNADRGKLRSKSGELKSDAKPDVDRPVQQEPKVTENEKKTKQEVESPPDPKVDKKDGQASGGKEKEKAAPEDVEKAKATAAFAKADTIPEPIPEPEVIPPEPVEAVDSAGEPLEGDPVADAKVDVLADQAQTLRDGAFFLEEQAAQGQGNAAIIQGNLALVKAEIHLAQEGITKSRDHSKYRREVTGKANEALAISEEKAEKVASEAPGYENKSQEGMDDTGPMRRETVEMAAENEANTPDDSEGAEKSRKQGKKINDVGDKSVTMDDAVTETKKRSQSLARDAAGAKQKNTESKAAIIESNQTLDKVDGRLQQMQNETTQAYSQLESMSVFPGLIRQRSADIIERASNIKAASYELENRLHGAQGNYLAGLEGVPELEAPEDSYPEDSDVLIQTKPQDCAPEAESPAESEIKVPPAQGGEAATAPGADGAAPANKEGKESEGADKQAADKSAEGGKGAATEVAPPAEAEFLNAMAPDRESLPSSEYPERPPLEEEALTIANLEGISPAAAENRETARRAAIDQRRTELAAATDQSNQESENLSAAGVLGNVLLEKASGFYKSIFNISWPDWGSLAKSLLDPRNILKAVFGGVTSGINMILSGVGKLFSAKNWACDPVGTLLGAASSIATGLTSILGTITAIAAAVAALMAALIFITFGAATPFAAPVIAVCKTIITVVGGWTLAVAKISMVLNALSLIKNIVALATADTAEEMRRASEALLGDIGNMGLTVLSIVGGNAAKTAFRKVGTKFKGLGRAKKGRKGAKSPTKRKPKARKKERDKKRDNATEPVPTQAAGKSKAKKSDKESARQKKLQKRWRRGIAAVKRLVRKGSRGIVPTFRRRLQLAALKLRYRFRKLKLVFKGSRWFIDAKMNPEEKIDDRNVLDEDKIPFPKGAPATATKEFGESRRGNTRLYCIVDKERRWHYVRGSSTPMKGHWQKIKSNEDLKKAEEDARKILKQESRNFINLVEDDKHEYSPGFDALGIGERKLKTGGFDEERLLVGEAKFSGSKSTKYLGVKGPKEKHKPLSATTTSFMENIKKEKRRLGELGEYDKVDKIESLLKEGKVTIIYYLRGNIKISSLQQRRVRDYVRDRLRKFLKERHRLSNRQSRRVVRKITVETRKI